MADLLHNADPKDIELRAGIDRSLRHPVMFFFTSGAAWLAVAVVLGFIASVKKSSPDFLAYFSWFDAGKVDAAHINALVYGWAAQAAFGVIIWLMSRLSRKECTNAGVILIAGHFWNGAVAYGIYSILAGPFILTNGSSGVPFMEFPNGCWQVMLVSYFLICLSSFVSFRVREGGHVYISQWYLLAAMLCFPWIFASAHLFIFTLDGHPLMNAAIAAWYKSALTLLFFIPVGLGAAYYLAPKVSGRPVYSYSLALYGFWALAVVGPWAGMQKLAGAPIPQFLPYVGAAAAVMILVPAMAAGINVLFTIRGHQDVVLASPSLRFTIAGMFMFIVYGVCSLLFNTSGTLKLTQFSSTGYGFDILSIYGVFSLCVFGAVYFIVPRITRREWLSRRFINWHFYLSLYGVISIVCLGIFIGYLEGQANEAWNQPATGSATLQLMSSWGMIFAWIFLIIANLFFCLHLLLMWMRLGRRSTHPTLLKKEHGHESPHGPEGEIDNYESVSA